jgi:hypothetical protein
MIATSDIPPRPLRPLRFSFSESFLLPSHADQEIAKEP